MSIHDAFHDEDHPMAGPYRMLEARLMSTGVTMSARSEKSGLPQSSPRKAVAATSSPRHYCTAVPCSLTAEGRVCRTTSPVLWRR